MAFSLIFVSAKLCFTTCLLLFDFDLIILFFVYVQVFLAWRTAFFRRARSGRGALDPERIANVQKHNSFNKQHNNIARSLHFLLHYCVITK